MKLNQIPEGHETKYVGVLTSQQKDSLLGQEFGTDSYFNPIQDADDNWIISIQEINNVVNTEFIWIKDLDIILFNPKPYPDLFL
jgi:hypothetical protein